MKSSRVRSTWLAVLLLSGTGAARGQEVPAGEPAQAPASELTPPPLVPIPAPGEMDRPSKPPEPPRAEVPSTDREQGLPTPSVSDKALPRREAAARPEDPVPRVAVELVGGAGGGVVVGTVGLVTGYLMGAATVGCDECGVVSLVGGFTGVLLGIPAGTWLGGRVMGGQGQLLSTAGGSLVGWGGALLGSLLLGAGDDESLALALLVLPVVGATTGYELSHSAQRRAASHPGEPVRVLPVAGFTRQGPRLGLMGRF